ncbi:MAG: hypothetical protein PCFJNLEI_02086 [Verrucomicrobiae bacterium]|nr:hypothetical protein [Verrucomicrobiae bacterium]
MKLIAHWRLNADARDSVGALHAEAQTVAFQDGAAVFNGVDSCVTVPDHPLLQFGTRPFKLTAQVKLSAPPAIASGEVVSKFDAARRNGFSIRIGSSKPGYSSISDARNVHASIDDAKLGEWQDHGKPWLTNTLVSTLTVFRGDLYTGIADAMPGENTPAIFRFRGGTEWEYCGKLDVDPRTRSVMSMIVHAGALYVGTGNWNWDKSLQGNCGPTHVFRYEGGTRWHDCGEFGTGKRVLSLASFDGKLYAGDDRGMVHRMDDDGKWTWCGQLGQHDRVNAMMIFQGRLYGAPHGAIFRYDGGTEWTCVGGLPDRRDGLFGENQTHTLQVYNSHLWAGMWPQGKVLRCEAPGRWTDTGQLGGQYPINEINDLAVYNGKLYAGVIPLAEVYRYETDGQWANIGRLVQNEAMDETSIRTWNRVPCLTVYRGRLFAGTSSCHGDAAEKPHPHAGRVYSIEAGRNVSFDDDLGSDWHEIAFERDATELRLSIDNKLVGRSVAFTAGDYNLSNTQPLCFGVGPQSHLAGAIREVRLFR